MSTEIRSNRAISYTSPKYVIVEGDKTEPYMIILGIVNGLSMDQIDPNLYPMIQTDLKRDRDRYQLAGNKSAVDQINKSLAYIYNYYQEEQKKEERRRYLMEIAFTDADVEQCLQDVINGKEVDLKTPRFRKALMQRFRQAKHDAIQNTDYVLADAIERGINGLIIFENQEKVYKAQERLLNEKSKRMQRVQNTINRTEKAWDIEIENTEKERESDITQLKCLKEKELKKFEDDWAKSPKRPFRPSPQLIEAKRKVEFYRNLGRCDALEEALKSANELEKEERDYFNNHLQQEYNRKRGGIESKYDVRINEKEVFYTNTLQRMRDQKDNEIKSLKKGLAFLESKPMIGVDANVTLEFEEEKEAEENNENQNENGSQSQLPSLSQKASSSRAPMPPSTPREPTSPRKTPKTARTPRARPPKPDHAPLTESQALFVQRRSYNYLLYTRANVK